MSHINLSTGTQTDRGEDRAAKSGVVFSPCFFYFFWLAEVVKFGRHTVLRGQGPKGRAGSSPAFGTRNILQWLGGISAEGRGSLRSEIQMEGVAVFLNGN
jgi:hypothetical protein